MGARTMGHKIRKSVSDFLFEYDTPRMVLVRDKKVGLTFRLIQLGVLCYILGWVFLYEKGYQDVDGIISSVSIKFKGIAITNIENIGTEIWDVADYVFPPQGDSSSVVMTNFIITPEQQMGNCSELPDVAPCKTDDDCNALTFRQSQGVLTGKCVPFNSEAKSCEVYAWCPVENDYVVPDPPLLRQAENFTLFIKNSISFPKHKINRQNLIESVTSDHLKTCLYDKDNDPFCPVFRLGYIVEQTGKKFSDLARKEFKFSSQVLPVRESCMNGKMKYQSGIQQSADCSKENSKVQTVIQWSNRCPDTQAQCASLGYGHPASSGTYASSAQPSANLVAKVTDLTYKFHVLGGTINIVIDWHCDLDWPLRYCKPKYEFHGLHDENSVSQGFNFRYARYYKEDGKMKRTLFKVFGIRIDILVNGEGGKFDIIPTMTTIGSGIGIFGVATVVCDLMLLHVLPKRNYYKEKKFKHAKSNENKTVDKEESLNHANNTQLDNGQEYACSLPTFPS